MKRDKLQSSDSSSFSFFFFFYRFRHSRYRNAKNFDWREANGRTELNHSIKICVCMHRTHFRNRRTMAQSFKKCSCCIFSQTHLRPHQEPKSQASESLPWKWYEWVNISTSIKPFTKLMCPRKTVCTNSVVVFFFFSFLFSFYLPSPPPLKPIWYSVSPQTGLEMSGIQLISIIYWRH